MKELLLRDQKKSCWYIRFSNSNDFKQYSFGSYVLNTLNRLWYMKYPNSDNIEKWFENTGFTQKSEYDEHRKEIDQIPEAFWDLREYLIRKSKYSLSEKYAIFSHYNQFGFVCAIGTNRIDYDPKKELSFNDIEMITNVIKSQIRYAGYTAINASNREIALDGFYIDAENETANISCAFYLDLAELLFSQNEIRVSECSCGTLFTQEHGNEKLCPYCRRHRNTIDGRKRKPYTKKSRSVRAYIVNIKSDKDYEQEKSRFDDEYKTILSNLKKGIISEKEVMAWLNNHHAELKRKYGKPKK